MLQETAGTGWSFQSPLRWVVGLGVGRRLAQERAASTAIRMSGRWTSGCNEYTIPNPDLSVSPASRVGLVIDDPAGSPEKGLV